MSLLHLRTVCGQAGPAGHHVLSLVVREWSPGPGRCWRELTMVARSVREKMRSSEDVSRSHVSQVPARTPSCVCGHHGVSGARVQQVVAVAHRPGSECF